MKRSRSVCMVAAFTAASAVLLGTGNAVAASGPASTGPAPWVDALVVMRSQADLAALNPAAPGRTRAARLASVERALRDTATTGQRDVLAMLNSRRAQNQVTNVTPLWIANEVAVRARPAVIRELASRADVREVRPELVIAAPSPAVLAQPATPAQAAPPEPNLTQVDAPALWDLGARGQGVVVASLDTGVDVSHPDLAGRWRGGSNSWFDPNGEHPSSPIDVSGHGTQTMSVIVGGNAGGSSIGVAPDARWIAAKIFNDHGAATTTGVHLSFQWLLNPDGNPTTPDAPNVVNSSWTMNTAACNLEFQPDLSSLRAAGLIPVFAAGNSGPASGTVQSPGNLPEALTVGGVDFSDSLDPSSSVGPSACSAAVTPALVAPSVNVRAADLYGGYVTQTGTSIAAPHVTGALALLLSAMPGTGQDAQEAAVTGGAFDLGAPGVDPSYGYGRLDALAAYQRLQSVPDYAVATTPTSVTVTPGQTANYAASVTATGGFSGDVALSVTGLPASVGTASVSPASVTGTGSAQVTVNTAAAAPPGSYPLTITGTSGSLTRSATATLVVQPPPDFTVSATPSSRSVTVGGATSYTIGIGSLNGFTDPVALSLAGLPASVGTATFSPTSIAGAGTSQLSVTTSAGAPPGSYPLTVTGSGSGIQHSIALNLTVTPNQNFTLTATPAAATVRRGGSTSYAVSVTGVGGFTGSVTLSRSGLPSGTSTSWSRNPVPVPGSSSLVVKAGGSTPRGTYTVRITGTSGALVQQVSVALTVQ
jgi:subtilisin family serine protease